MAGISCSWSWTRSFVLSWTSDADMAPYQRRGRGQTARWQSMPKSMCTYYSFCFAFTPAGLTAFTLFSYSEQGLIFRKEFVLNKNIVHLIDEIFWNQGFKHETQAEMVIPIVRIISTIPIYTMCAILITRIIARSSRTWTCGPRVDGQEEVLSPKP